jgi:peptide-methionine (S)-S-oxide reductase
MPKKQETEIAVFGGGCFWCGEAIFENIKGVVSVMPGYAGGHTENPTYDQVSSGRTGHAEVIKIEFDPKEITYQELLTVFFATHDPTTPGRQGDDVGEQYRSIILYSNGAQKQEAEKMVEEINKQEGSDPIVTEIKPLEQFYEAEDYHKKYYLKHRTAPYCQLVINPKLKKVQEQFAELLKAKGKEIISTDEYFL